MSTNGKFSYFGRESGLDLPQRKGIWADQYPNEYDRTAVMREVDERIREYLFTNAVSGNLLDGSIPPAKLTGASIGFEHFKQDLFRHTYVEGSGAGAYALTNTSEDDVSPDLVLTLNATGGRPWVAWHNFTINLIAGSLFFFWRLNGVTQPGRISYVEGGAVAGNSELSGVTYFPGNQIDEGSNTLELRYGASNNGNAVYNDTTSQPGDTINGNVPRLFAMEL